jgi:CheY-like chemotaxis protein
MTVHVLSVEDGPGDVRLTRQAFQDADVPIQLHAACDGVEAMAFLSQAGSNADVPRPDPILLDLNLPRIHGREVLARIKWRRIRANGAGDVTADVEIHRSES